MCEFLHNRHMRSNHHQQPQIITIIPNRFGVSSWIYSAFQFVSLIEKWHPQAKFRWFSAGRHRDFTLCCTTILTWFLLFGHDHQIPVQREHHSYLRCSNPLDCSTDHLGNLLEDKRAVTMHRCAVILDVDDRTLQIMLLQALQERHLPHSFRTVRRFIH